MRLVTNNIENMAFDILKSKKIIKIIKRDNLVI